MGNTLIIIKTVAICYRLCKVHDNGFPQPPGDICNSYTTGTSALPDIYACAQRPQAQGQVRIYRQSTRAGGITNMFYFSLQAHHKN